MTTGPPATIFISYATADGADAAADLRRDLTERGFCIWQDIAALQGGRDWWTQIEAALKSTALQHVVLLLTPAALSRPVIRDEIHLARQQGKTLIPVRATGFDDYAKLPRHIGQVLDLDKPEHHATFLSMITGPSLQKPVPMMISAPPADYVARTAEIDALKALLLASETKEAVAITAALRGTTGYGKTTLARALAYDPDIRDAYFDGTLFVELGQQGRGRIVALIADIIGLIDPDRRRDFATIDGAKTALGEALGNRKFLFVIDDVWNRGDLMPFLHGGPSTTRLITTRFAGELPSDVVQERVSAMTGGADGEAWQMLAAGLPTDQVAANKPALVALAERRHNWPQALRLANGFLRTRMGLSKHDARARSGPRPVPGSLADAIKAANAGLDARGGTALDPNRLKPTGDDAERYEQRHTSVAEGMALNLSLLDETNRARFAELVVFPEDVDVPIGMAARLWAETGGLDRHDTESLLVACDDASLLHDLDFSSDTFRFHDSVREYLHDRAGAAGLVAQHKRLIQAMGDMGGATAALAGEADYFYRYVPEHLAGADDRKTLDALLLDPGWLQAKLDATGSPQALVADYERHGKGQMQNFIGRTLRLTTGICARDRSQLLPQLVGRLMSCADPAAPAFLASARRLIQPPALVTQTLSLTPPGAESARLEGHGWQVAALLLLPDGRLASASWDRTIRLWDLRSGAEAAILEGHSKRVGALTLLPDGRLASASWDATIRLWDVKKCTETHRLEGHTMEITALTLLPDGRLASGSGDTTIRLWDLGTGVEAARLRGHAKGVTALTVLPDGRLASGSSDNTILIWDVGKGDAISLLKGHTRGVTALKLLADGRLASASSDKTIRLWDLESGAETGRLEAHTAGVTALTQLSDGQLTSASWDTTIRLWDVKTGVENACLEGHTDWVTSLTPLSDRRLASGSSDTTIRLWDLEFCTETARLEAHTAGITALTLLPVGRLASASWDATIRLWDVKTGAETARLNGHTSVITSLTLLPDGRLASGSGDKTIRLWDLRTGVETARLSGHAAGITALTLVADGRLASASDDNTIRLWDVRSGLETARLDGHSTAIMTLLPDGQLASATSDRTILLWNLVAGTETARLQAHTSGVTSLKLLSAGLLASGSSDTTIRLWNLTSRAELACLVGHTDTVLALAELADGQLASGSQDRTIRLWDSRTGHEIIRLEVDAPVLCLCALPSLNGSGRRLVAGDEIGRLHWLEIVE